MPPGWAVAARVERPARLDAAGLHGRNRVRRGRRYRPRHTRCGEGQPGGNRADVLPQDDVLHGRMSAGNGGGTQRGRCGGVGGVGTRGAPGGIGVSDSERSARVRPLRGVGRGGACRHPRRKEDAVDARGFRPAGRIGSGVTPTLFQRGHAHGRNRIEGPRTRHKKRRGRHADRSDERAVPQGGRRDSRRAFFVSGPGWPRPVDQPRAQRGGGNQ